MVKTVQRLKAKIKTMTISPNPKIVCLCGSTRFKDEFMQVNKEETLAGKIVLSVGTFPHTDNGQSPENALGEDVKKKLDELHKRKIDLADEVLIINVGGYVGQSTASEIAYAEANRKPIRWLEPPISPRSV